MALKLRYMINFKNRNLQSKIYYQHLMSQNTVKALDFNVQNVGQHMKATKKRYTWKFQINGYSHKIVCSASFISGKIKVSLDGKELIVSDIANAVLFQYNFNLNGCQMVILQQASDFELRINNKEFNHILGQQKNAKLFKKEQQEQTEDEKQVKNFSLENKNRITLNMGLVGNGMKKKKNIQSDNWKQMGCDDIEYFKKVQQAKNRIYTTINNTLPEQHKGNQQKIIQQFNTMQKLFSTVNPQQLSIPKNQNALNLMEDFNTMRQLFSTKVPSGINPLSNNLSEQVDGKNCQYTTLQQMFCTQQPQNKKQQIKNSQQFSTMQQLFQTLKIQDPLQNKSNEIVNKSQIDFNTMQNLFQTINQQKQSNGPLMQNTKPSQKGLKISGIQANLPNPQDFSTMANLFKTINPDENPVKNTLQHPQQKIQNQQNKNPNIPEISDFSTMANLFKTNNNIPQPKTSYEQSNALNQMKNLNQVNMADFNTMQNLFKTMGGSQIGYIQDNISEK